MRLLVTGRGGQLAQSLAERGGGDVSLCGRPDLDLAIPGSAHAAILATRPAIVINAAAFTAVDLAESEEELAQRVNGEGAGEIAEATRELGVPLIQISTDYVFNGQATMPYTEASATAPINAYGRTKLAGEQAVRAANPDHVIIRTSWLISAVGRNFVSTIVELSQQRDTVSVVSDQHGNPTAALDLADAILVVARRWASEDRTGFGQTYHIAGDGISSWYDLAVAVNQELDRIGAKSSNVNPIPTTEWPTPATRPSYSALNCDKFIRDFGYVMPHWRKSLRRIVARLAA